MGLGRTKELTTPKSNGSKIQLPWIMNIKKELGLGVPGFFVFVQDLSALWQTSDNPADNGDLAIHYVQGKPKAPICNHNYFDPGEKGDNCEFCEMPGSFKDQEFNDSYIVKPLLCLCLNLIGQTRPGTDKDGKSVEYKQNPLKILQLRYKKNFELVEQYHQYGSLSIYDDPNSIFTMEQEKKKDGSAGKFTEPRVLGAPEIKGLGKDFVTNVKDHELTKEIYDRFNPAGKTDEELKQLHAEIRGLILEQYGNIDRTHKLWTEDVKVIWPTEEVIEKDTAEETTSDAEEDNSLDK